MQLIRILMRMQCRFVATEDTIVCNMTCRLCFRIPVAMRSGNYGGGGEDERIMVVAVERMHRSDEF